MIYSIKKLEN